MRQRLILHIGTHKTGSTTIQNYLYLNRLWLRPLGVHYPKPLMGPMFYVNNHKDLRDTARIEGRPRNPGPHPELGTHDARLAAYTNAILEGGAPLSILSCEGWSSVLNRYADRLKVLKNRFDIKVIAFMRRPDHWAEAFYRQRVANVAHRETMPFSQFVAQPPMEEYLFERAKLFGWWAEAFGAENLTVIPYEPAVGGFDLLEKFFDASGFPGGLPRHLLFRKARSNPTLPRAEAELMRQASEQGRAPVRPKRIVRRPEASYFNALERAALLDRAAPDMDAITKAYVRDGRQEMFVGEPETYL